MPLCTPGAPDSAFAADVWDTVRAGHLAPEQYRVLPRRLWDIESARRTWAGAMAAVSKRPSLPPLLRGYLRLGAWVCGPPAHDLDFGAADFLVLLALDRVDPRYLRHFLGEAP